MRVTRPRISGLCAVAVIWLLSALPVNAGDGGGDGGGENDRFKDVPPVVLDQIRRQNEESRRERDKENRLAHAVQTVAALDGLAGGEPGDSAVTP